METTEDLKKRILILETENKLLRAKGGKKYFRAKEIADIFSVGLSTVWLYADRGLITPRKISMRVTVFNVDEFEDAILNSTVPKNEKVKRKGKANA